MLKTFLFGQRRNNPQELASKNLRKILVPKVCHGLQVKSMRPRWSLLTDSELLAILPNPLKSIFKHSSPPFLTTPLLAQSLKKIYGNMLLRNIQILHEVEIGKKYSRCQVFCFSALSWKRHLGRAKPSPCPPLAPSSGVLSSL